MKIHKKRPTFNTIHPTLPTMPIFWNRTVDKGTMKRLIAWFLVHYGRSATVSMIEDLKQVGFQHATRAGVSLGIEDLRIPPSKTRLVQEANLEVNMMEVRYHQGYISIVERLQKVIDTWNSTSEILKEDVVDNFLATDPLNPVYMMAFSGARGNLSQVRQLVGMRGLMSNPQGEIIALPIRSNFREGLTVTEYIISCYGARKGLVDTALRTANSGYLTRRLVDVAQDIVIRITCCNAPGTGLPLTSFHENKQLVHPLEERLLGRVLSAGVLNDAGKLVFRARTPISQAMASEIVSYAPKMIFVRSVVLCQAKRGLCRLCYGWNLATGTVVSIGEAVGIIAAQSIGEPGTQLTMRTFHTGGVFSGRAIDEIRAPHAGIVDYPKQIKSKFVRTRHGEPGILTCEDGELIFSNKDKKTTLFCKKGTIITVSAGDIVHENQLIGEIASYGAKKVVGSWRFIKSDLDGEITYDKIEVLKRRPNSREQITSVLINPKVANQGYLWILHGHVNTFEVPLKLLAQTGDQIEKQSIVSCCHRVSPRDGGVIFELEENQQDIKKIRITQTFGSLQFDGVNAWLPPQCGIKQTISTKIGNIPIDGKAMILSADPMKHEGSISFDWPTYSDGLSEDDIEGNQLKEANIQYTPYPLQYSVLEEQKYLIHGDESWIINVMGGQSVGPQQCIATQIDSKWYLAEGTLYLESFEYRIKHQSWIQVKTPSLLDIESGKANYQIFAKSGWIIPVMASTRIKEYTLIAGSILFGRWNLPGSRILVEQVEGCNAILIRPIHTYPIYPAMVWDERLELHQQIPTGNKSIAYPRTIMKSFSLPFAREILEAKETLVGQLKTESMTATETNTNRTKSIASNYHEENNFNIKVQKGLSPFTIEWTWPDRQSPWIGPKHGPIHGHITFVSNTALYTSKLWKIQDKENKHQEIMVNDIGRGIHHFTPLVQQIILSPDEGEIQRLLPRMRYKYRPISELVPNYNPKGTKTRAKSSNKPRQLITKPPKITKPANVSKSGKVTNLAKIPKLSQSNQRLDRKNQLLQKRQLSQKRQLIRIITEQKKRQLIHEKINKSLETKWMRRMVVVRPEQRITFATYGANVCIPLGSLIYQGEELLPGQASPVSGKVMEIRRDRVTLRLGQPYRAGWQARLLVLRKEIVQAEKLILKLLYFKTKTGDIVQGLPKIEEVLEARRKKGNDTIRSNPQDVVRKVHSKYLRLYGGMEIASTYSMFEMQMRLLRRVQLVYRSQGVQIADKHIEIIVLRMTSRVMVEKAYGTGILPGEILEKRRADHINRRSKRIRYCPVVLGITKAALTTKGFISSASFQETTRVLTQATLRGKSDWLQGLKENVILGRLIPAGVGIYGHYLPAHQTNTQKMLEDWVLPRIITGQAAMRALFHDTTRYWQDLEAVMDTPKKMYPITPYKIDFDLRFPVPLIFEKWMTEQEIKSVAIHVTEEEKKLAKARFQTTKITRQKQSLKPRRSKSKKKRT